MGKIRTFIAIPLREAIVNKLEELQQKLKQEITQGVKWVDCQSMHITVKFIGQIDQALVPRIKGLMNNYALGRVPFDLLIEKLGVFPNTKNARVLWIGIAGQVSTLEDIHHYFDKSLEEYGISEEDRKYNCHITLGRIKKKQPQKIITSALQKHSETVIGPINVSSIVLFQSVLKPGGAVYSPLATVDLGL